MQPNNAKEITVEDVRDFLLDDYHGGDIVIYGAAIYGRMAYSALRKNADKIRLDRVSICDKELAGSIIFDKKVKKPDDIFLENTIVIICAGNRFLEIYEHLITNKITNLYHAKSLLALACIDDFRDDYEFYGIEAEIGRYSTSIDKYFNNTSREHFSIYELVVSITDFCTLKCKHCIKQNAYLENRRKYDIDKTISALQKIIQCVDKINNIRISGGEPFLHTGLYELVNWCCACKKVVSVEVVTNSTIIPSGKNLDCLAHPKVIINMDDYGKVSIKLEELSALFTAKQINHKKMKLPYWIDFGFGNYAAGSNTELKKRFTNCFQSRCFSLSEYLLTRCDVGSINCRLGKINIQSSDYYIDISNPSISIESLRNSLYDLIYRRDYLEFCKYCKGVSVGGRIPVAEQV